MRLISLSMDADGRIEIEDDAGARVSMSRAAALRVVAWCTAPDARSRALVERSAPTLFDAVRESLGGLEPADVRPEWQARLGRVVELYHRSADASTFTNDLASHLRAAPPDERLVPRRRPLATTPPTRLERAPWTGTVAAPLDPPAFDEVVDRRRTHRDFAGRTVARAAFEYALTRTFAQLGMADPGLGAPLPHKSFMSGGSRHEIWPLVIVHDVEGYEAGAWQLRDDDGTLARVGDAPSRSLLDHWTYEQGFALDCAFVVLFVSDLSLFTWKYRSPAAYRLAWADLGAALQMYGLSLTAAGLAGVPTGAIRSAAVSEALGLTPDEVPGFAFFCGYADGPSTVERLRRASA